MLVFSTRLPIKDEIERQDALRLFINWITESPHYPIDHVDYDLDSTEDFDISSEGVELSIRHYFGYSTQMTACRLVNREDRAVWTNDCIFVSENGEKSLLIQLDCNLNEYGAQLPSMHKPGIVRILVQSGFCKDDSGIPVTDEALDGDQYYDICASIMRGEYAYSMPMVYLSCDRYGKPSVNAEYLAWQLGGVAHVILEKSRETSLRLKEDTGGANAYTGYVGIYYPGTRFIQKKSPEYFEGNSDKMLFDIIGSVWKALTNRLDSSIYNWNQIIALQSRQRLADMEVGGQDKEQLDEYMEIFDRENESLREQIKELNQQIYSLSSQLDGLRASMSAMSGKGGFFSPGQEPELYPSEKSDMLVSILSQIFAICDPDSRPYDLIKSLLEANPRVGECERVTSGIKTLFNAGGRIGAKEKQTLKNLGFTVEEDGRHYKLIFHDPRYHFTVSKTPGDQAQGKNFASNVISIIDIEHKFI